MFAMKSKFVYIVVGAEHEDIWNSWLKRRYIGCSAKSLIYLLTKFYSFTHNEDEIISDADVDRLLTE